MVYTKRELKRVKGLEVEEIDEFEKYEKDYRKAVKGMRVNYNFEHKKV